MYRILVDDKTYFAKCRTTNAARAIESTPRVTSEVKFVNYIAEKTGLTCKTIGPILFLEEWAIMVFESAEGQQPMLKMEEYQKPEVISVVGRDLRKFHDAARQFAKDEPDTYDSMQIQDWKRQTDGWLDRPGRVIPNIPINEQTYGICHGDMHE